MSFVPFTRKEKNFAIIDVVSTEGIILKGREGYLYLEDVSTIKDPEVGQTVFLTKVVKANTRWTLVAEEKPKKTGKGNPVLTAAQRAQFEASCA